MPATPNHTPDQVPAYEIRIHGHLEPHWESWFDSMTVTPEANGDTILTGNIVDQAALHGLLRKIRDLGLPLLSITRLDASLDTTHRKETP